MNWIMDCPPGDFARSSLIVSAGDAIHVMNSGVRMYRIASIHSKAECGFLSLTPGKFAFNILTLSSSWAPKYASRLSYGGSLCAFGFYLEGFLLSCGLCRNVSVDFLNEEGRVDNGASGDDG